MDGRNDRSALLCQFVQETNEVQGCGRIEAGGGFIEEDDGRIDKQFQADGSSFLLASGNASNSGVSDVGVPALLEA